MIIEGPLRISAETSDEKAGFSLNLSFAEEFQALDRDQQVADFSDYLERLRAQSATLDEADPNRQGMLVMLQVGEQLLPLIREGALPLNETLEIEIQQDLPLAGFLSNPSDRIN